MAASSAARGKAAQAWCKPETEHKEMDVVLGEAFAEILDEIWSMAWLGNATTGELIDEIKARADTRVCQDYNCSYCGLHYKTAGPHCSEEVDQQ